MPSRTPFPLVRRRLLAVAAAVAFAFVVSSVSMAFAVAAKDGPGRALVNVIKERIGPNDEIHYAVHTALGQVFGLCPCTDGLSRLEYGKAAYHRPMPGR